MANGVDDFRGVGWAFPVAAETGRDDPAHRGRIAMARLDQSVRESILLIIGTAKGERLMRPGFGCGIHELVFAPNDATTVALLTYEVREALVDWEPRAEVLDIQVAPDEEEGNKLLINLRYKVRQTNNVFNLVYPFYLERSRV
jgi:hypothetical protein